MALDGVKIATTDKPCSITQPRVNNESADLVNKGEREGFVVVARKRRTRPGITGVGSNTGGTITAVKKRLNMFVGRVNIDATEDDLLGYLKDTFENNDFTCAKLNTKTEYACFRITAPVELREKIDDPGLWPAGVIVRPFYFRSEKTSFLGTPNAAKNLGQSLN